MNTHESIKRAVSELTNDGTFQIASMYYYEPTKLSGLLLNSNTAIKEIFFTDNDRQHCFLGLSRQANKRFMLEAVLASIGIEPLPKATSFIEWISNASKKIRQNWPLIIQAFDKKNRRETIRRIIELEEKLGLEEMETFKQALRDSVRYLTDDGSFQIAELTYDKVAFGNVVLLLKSDIYKIDIRFVKDRDYFFCELKLSPPKNNWLSLEDLLKEIGLQPILKTSRMADWVTSIAKVIRDNLDSVKSTLVKKST